MKKRILTIPLLLFLIFLMTSCRYTAPGAPANSGNGPLGTWYEQSPFGGVLEISESSVKYTAYENRYIDEVPLKITEGAANVLLETREEDFFTFVDMSYDPANDLVEVHDWPHTDGDGGWHLIEFRRTPYTPPPAPVYGPPEDLSDPDAQKEFADLTVRSMNVSFFDEGVYHDPNSSMAMEPPYKDFYTYNLRVREDGSALVSSSFCQEITIPKETVDELQRLVRENDLGAINGIDIHTPDLPYDAPDYTLELELVSGEMIRSLANGDNIPENWANFQEPMHHLLFFAFVDAGYNYIGGDFHSTAPMLRVGSKGFWPDSTPDAPARRVSYDSVRVEPDWRRSYDYSLHTDYLVFSDISPDCPGLRKALEELGNRYKSAAEKSLAEDYKIMESIPKSVWKKAERLYCYSFYTIANDRDYGSVYSFLVTEGHACSVETGMDKFDTYPYWRYNIDTATGRTLSAADLFVSPEEACRVLTETMRERYGNYSEEGKYIHSDAFPEALKSFVEKPGPEGISWYAGYDGIEFTFPAALFPMADYEPQQTLYYDELQDVLNEKYCSVR